MSAAYFFLASGKSRGCGVRAVLKCHRCLRPLVDLWITCAVSGVLPHWTRLPWSGVQPCLRGSGRRRCFGDRLGMAWSERRV